jgi:putative hemolysin
MLQFFIFLGLLICSAFFSGSETVVTALNEITLTANPRSGRIQNLLLWLCRRKSTVIGAILVGNNIVNTVLAVYAGVIADSIFSNNQLIGPSLAPVVASIITIFFLLIFGEVIPKQLGVSFSKKLAPLVAFPIYIVVLILKPITKAMDMLSRLILRALPIKQDSSTAPTIQEMLAMAKYSEKAGHIDSIERRLMARASKFNDLSANDVMIPKTMVTGISIDASLNDVIQVFGENMYTRVPVYMASMDEIIGVFNFKELLRLKDSERKSFRIKNKMIKPLYIPETVAIGELLERMRENRSHMAIVIDEYGTMLGLVTMEDIVERVFGIIDDEYDEAKPKQETSAGADRVMDGHTSLQDISEMLNIKFPAKVMRKVNTLSGFLTYVRGDFPREKEAVAYAGHVFVVLEVDGMRVGRVLVKREERGEAKAEVKRVKAE